MRTEVHFISVKFIIRFLRGFQQGQLVQQLAFAFALELELVNSFINSSNSRDDRRQYTLWRATVYFW